MTAPTQTEKGDRDASFVELDAAPDATVDSQLRHAERIRLLVQPVVAVLLAVAVLVWAFGLHDLTDPQKATINRDNIIKLAGQHLLITFLVAVIVIVIGVTVGLLVTRPGLTWLSPVLVGLANIGASAPAVGLLVLYYLAVSNDSAWTSRLPAGPVAPWWWFADIRWVGILPIAFYALLPVLRNTILGVQEVDDRLIDAGRGQGMSNLTVLRRIEFPLAVPYILAGLRTSLVLAVGTATLSFLVGAGGLGILIDTGYKLNDNVALVVGGVLAVALALLVDWLGALAEQFLGPRGLR